MKPCPCGSTKLFMKCCKPYLTGKALPQTAKSLMCSRYTAYVRGNIHYIENTMRNAACEHFDFYSAQKWAASVKWKRLEIMAVIGGGLHDEHGEVCFKAYFVENGQQQVLEERSLFEKIAGRWFYVGQVK